MNKGQLRVGVIAFVALATLGTSAWAQSAVQGDEEEIQTDFHSPMVVNTVLAAADKNYWHTKDWFSVQEYKDLGKFTCDGVSLRSDYKPKKNTWNSGLETAVEPLDGERVRVRFKVFV